MKILKIYNTLAFRGIRQDRNTVEQLKHDNDYDLNLPNQRRISNAIKELGEIPGEENIDFLLDVSKNLRYGTNIDIGKKPYNNWQEQLNDAVKKSLRLSDISVQKKLIPIINKTSNIKKELTTEELEILANRELLLSKVDPKELKNIKNENIAKLQRNLSYFVVSSEVSTKQKIYILKKLNYFMSDDYSINPQLKDKKTQILAEIINDIVINTPESKIPNIKAVNQREHGICVAISICRKALAYEDKANYVDMILTELDDSPNMMVYDRTNLGKHKKVPIPKADIDYNYAIKKGYRIIDASVMNWMNAADTAGAFNDVIGAYSAFDKDNFGTFQDTHIHKDIDKKLEKYQDYFRSCKKAKDAAGECKKELEKDKYFTSKAGREIQDNIYIFQSEQKLIMNILKEIYPSFDNEKLRKISNNIQSLALKDSSQKEKVLKDQEKYTYITNEESEYKAEKIINYLIETIPNKGNKNILKEKAPELVELIDEIKSKNLHQRKEGIDKFADCRNLYYAAAAYRTMRSFELDIPDYLNQMMRIFNIPDDETYLIENLNSLSKNIRTGKINPELKEKLHQNFESETNEIIKKTNSQNSKDEILAQILDDYANTVKYIITSYADDIYYSILLENRKIVLLTQLESVKNEIEHTKNKNEIEAIASNFNLKADKKVLLKNIDKYIKILNDENCTDEQYDEILNKSGHKSHLMDMKEAIENSAGLIFKTPNEQYIAGFNLINNLPQNASIEETKELYKAIAEDFNNMSRLVSTLQKAIEITSENGKLLNSPDPKYEILKKLENMGEIPTEQELESLRNKFDKYFHERYNEYGDKTKFKDIPKSITTFTPMEKNALNKYRKNINAWYATSSRKLNDVYLEIKEPLEELNREIGVQKGEYWTSENNSGLMENQALKIFEHMTDRPYYEETNIRSGIEKIKKSPYSGSSMTSVKSDEPAMHGQYVVDIKPIAMVSEDTKKIKNIIFHDNTWGASEHENTWIDKQGFLRTDYNDEYGGENGFITNENYLNGKLEDNLIDKSGEFKPKKITNKKYNKLLKWDVEFSFPMIRSIMMQGESPDAMSTVKEIKQTLLLPSYDYIDNLKEYASQMTQNEIKTRIKKIETAGKDSTNTYKTLIKRIKGYNTFDKGIDSEEKYYNLSANDKLRLIAEKVAIIKSYDDIPDINTYNIEVKSQKDLDKLHKKLRTEARNNFDYIMAKNPDILKYATESSRKEIYEELKAFAKDNNINLSYKAMTKIVNSMKRVKNSSYNGSISQGVDLMIANFEKYLKLKTHVDSKKAKEFVKKIRPIIENNLTITEEDIKTGFDTYRNEQIASWIDREFSPKSDKEFVQILNNLRNMTTEDYIKYYDSKISDSDLGIKSINGYDIIKMIRGDNEKIQNTFINTIFSESYYKDINESQTRAYYDLKKLARNLSGGTYVGGVRSFDDLYSDFYYSFQDLTIKKEFDKYKDNAFRKYFRFPAYPVVEITTPEIYENSLNSLYDKLNGYMDYIYAYKNQHESLELIKKLKQYADKKFSESGELTPKQLSVISDYIDKVMYLNVNDDTILDKKTEGEELLASGNRDVVRYKQYIDSLYNLFKMYEYTADGKTMKEAQQITKNNIDTYKKTFIVNSFDPKYQSKAFEILNRWISAKSKAVWIKDHFNPNITDESSQEAKNIADIYEQNVENADAIFNEFGDLYVKHHLLSTPNKYMNEYLLLCAKDAKYPNEKYSQDDQEWKDALEKLRDSFESNLKSLLYKSDMMKLQTILMNCAEKGNLNAVRNALKTSTIELTNGTVVTMDSDEGLNLIVAPMLNEENLDTAALFLNQLGLSENIAKLICDGESLDVGYKNYNRIQSILKSSDSQAKYVKDEFLKLGNFDNNPNYEEIIKNFEEKIINKCNKTTYRISKEIFKAAIEDTLKDIKQQPNQSKTILLGTNLKLAISGLRDVVKENINELNTPLMIIQKRYDLMKKLILPNNTKLKEDVEKYMQSLQSLMDYEHSKTKSFPNISINSE